MDDPATQSPQPEHDEFVGMDIGGAVLRRRIGAGGMGLVYEAWQEPPGRLVAVKLMRDVLASEDARFRFRHEAQVLAGLKHPGIAQIYSAGTHRATSEIPYFLMEYVADAQPITDYLRGRDEAPGGGAPGAGSLDEILALAVQLCHAVQAGHAKGVIHRDLKPANVLVDAGGELKVIDFGIARTTGERDEDTPQTRTGQFVGTIPYMSPEQFMGPAGDLDVRSDVYALGVILYEMLTGRLPYETEGMGVMELIGAIQHRPPTPPAKVRADLAGDVSIILRKALSKEPAARYASAAALADDLQRYLDRRPIMARPPSLVYQWRLFARRHRIAALSLVGVVLTVVGALVAISLFAASESKARRLAEEEEARARKLLHASAEFIPVVADHVNNKLGGIVGTTRVRLLLAEELEGLAARISAIDGASSDPAVAYAVGEAELAVSNIKGGAGHANVGSRQVAGEHLQRAISAFEDARAADPDNPTYTHGLLGARISLGGFYNVQGQAEKARDVLRAVATDFERAQAAFAEEPWVLAVGLDLANALGNAYWATAQYDEALAEYERAIVWCDRLDFTGKAPEIRACVLVGRHVNLATSYAALGRTAEAAQQFERVRALGAELEKHESALALDALWHVHSKLAAWEAENDDPEQAVARSRKALAVAERLSGADTKDVEAKARLRSAWDALGSHLERTGLAEEATSLFMKSLAALREEAKAQPENRDVEWDLRIGLTRLGVSRAFAGAFEEARTLLDEARAIQAVRTARRPDHPEERSALAGLDHADGQVHYLRGVNPPEGVVPRQELKNSVARIAQAIEQLQGVVEDGGATEDVTRSLELWKRHLEIAQEALAALGEEK